jgi:hypothetical protein
MARLIYPLIVSPLVYYFSLRYRLSAVTEISSLLVMHISIIHFRDIEEFCGDVRARKILRVYDHESRGTISFRDNANASFKWRAQKGICKTDCEGNHAVYAQVSRRNDVIRESDYDTLPGS